MPERSFHSEVVGAWRDGWAGHLSQQELVDVFERVLATLWCRAHLSLGDITLMAIVDRVLHEGVRVYPHLAPLKVEASGTDFGALREAAPRVAVALLEESLVFLVVELLRVLGVLTGEILTPGLHAELRKVQVRPADERGGSS
ncbi:hypothetical protein JY651_00625 [Pyxidicoccus parkwayensis]|uniref:Uncharacterized protein n=1 Tax=Pyxidicoccus parkwayensis TaxID=2813578 RepID=A0ABX7P168_9BACT|nr:hypothetical protein [Pyxidicoccus parkwaysis]QSQ23524.1 hypothetical protein JY651_00625 [Pyxidicoccus parkwaysis]